jgi:hypothetical protein
MTISTPRASSIPHSDHERVWKFIHSTCDNLYDMAGNANPASNSHVRLDDDSWRGIPAAGLAASG